MSNPMISMTRHASCDEVYADEPTRLDDMLRLVVTYYAGTRLGPIGLKLPFHRWNNPKPGYLIPPTVGDDLLANELARALVHIDDIKPVPNRPLSFEWEQITQGMPRARPAALAASAHVRGMIRRTHEERTFIIAGLAQAVAPIAGVVLVRDIRSAKAQKEALDLFRIPSRIVGPPVPCRNTLMRVRPADS